MAPLMKEMTPWTIASQLAAHFTTSSIALMGQASIGRPLAVQVEGYDVIQMDYIRKENPSKLRDEKLKENRRTE